jgi:polyhydroxybutyrate depolymerase
MRALRLPQTSFRFAATAIVLGWASGGCHGPRAAKMAGPPSNPLVAARPYHVVAPSGLDPEKALPLVVVLHGFGGNSEKIERYYRLDPLAQQLGFFVVYPDGTEETRKAHRWNRLRQFWNATDACCNRWGAQVDDVGYLDAVIDDMGAHYRIDPKRIFVMGLSNGGYMSYRYACDRAARVAAIVSQAGAMWKDARRCRPSEPVAVLQIHGTRDQMVSFESYDASPAPSAHQSVADWVTFDKCNPTADGSAPALDLIEDEETMEEAGAETTIEKWTGCRGVELWTMRGARHVPQPHHPLWARAIYGWLAAHPKP